MKKLLTIIMVAMAVTTAAWSQKKVVLPGKGNLDLEPMNKDINLQTDFSKLSLSELRVLRNAFAARQGYCFMSADLRAIFGQTSWYDSLMYEHWNEEDDGTTPTKHVSYTKQETAFINKLKARENELKTKNFKPATKGWRVNVNNLVNPFQVEELPAQLSEALGKNGFAIVPNTNKQLFHVYERNDYHDFPSFVTTDLYLQLYHLYFDCLLRDAEQERLNPAIATFCQEMFKEMTRIKTNSKDSYVQGLAHHNALYFAIGYQLLTGKSLPLPQADRQKAAEEIGHVMAEEPDLSDFIGGDYRHDIVFGYNLFRPRGHYTRNDTLRQYFRGMMWLQTVPFCTDKAEQLEQAVLMAHAIGSSQRLTQLYNKVSEPITYLMGSPDNVTIMQVYNEVKKTGLTIEKLVNSRSEMQKIRDSIEKIGEVQTRIRPKFEYTSHCKINLMPQRYMPDAEVLQEMVDYDSKPTLRDVPKGLDVLAAMGCSAAERILLDEIGENKRWKGYEPMLKKMKQRMGEINWQETVATKWMDALKTIQQPNSKYPYFMLTPQWDKKNLNAALASWAELKHDAILYAKSPYGAECGGGGPPEPIVKGYVEPNIGFWQKAIALLQATEDVLMQYGLQTEKGSQSTSRLKEEAEFLLQISQKELAGKQLTEEEYAQIEYIGATFENISLELIREPEQWLMDWSDVQGPDKHIAVVADVYTANANNNPVENRSVLYEAVGPAYDIYVVVEIDGYLYLTRGAVFSYREFQQSINDPRMTDEEWQEKLKQKPRLGIPDWMQEITVPLKGEEVQDNEEVFYSSGC